MDAAKERELQQLCAKVCSAIDLADARVKVYGSQSRIRKWAKLLKRQQTIDKFDTVVERLEALTEQAWQLQASIFPAWKRTVPCQLLMARRTHCCKMLRPADH